MSDATASSHGRKPKPPTCLPSEASAKEGRISGMAGEWIETTVGEQATLQRGIDITKAEQRVGMVPVVSSGGVSSYHDTPAATGPGVILGRKGVVGSVYYIPSDYWTLVLRIQR